MSQNGMFDNAEFMEFQRVANSKFYNFPKLAESLDLILTGHNAARTIADVGAGMGELAASMQELGYTVDSIEKEQESLAILKREHPELNQNNNSIFHADIAKYEFSKKYDAMYMHGSIFILMRKSPEIVVVESYVGQPGSWEPVEVTQVLDKIQTALNDNSPLIISVMDLPDGSKKMGSYRGGEADYKITSTYMDRKVIRSRTISLDGWVVHSSMQPKLVVALEKFQQLARHAGFTSMDYSADGLWYVVNTK